MNSFNPIANSSIWDNFRIKRAKTFFLNLTEGNVSKMYNFKIIRKKSFHILYEKKTSNIFYKLKCTMNAFSLLHGKIKFQISNKASKRKKSLM